MNKKILVLLLLSMPNFGQTKLQNEIIEGNKLKLKFNTSIDYSIKKEGNRNVFHVQNFQDESAPGDVKLSSNDIFISLPKVENPRIRYIVLSKKEVSAIPEFNDEVKLDKENKLIYSKSQNLNNPIKNHFKIKGYLWIEDNYCLQLEIIPAIYISSQNIIEIIEKFEVELEFKDGIRVINKLDKKSSKNYFISNLNYKIKNSSKKYNVKSDDSWIDYTKQYVKIGTNQDGIYRITKNNLESLNINSMDINPKSFRLFCKGLEIPIFVKGESDFSFNVDDYIEFIGLRNMGGHHRELSGYDKPYNEYLGRYTDTTIYWLTWGGIDGKRAENSDGNQVTSNDTIDYYSQIDHYEKNIAFDFSCANLVRRETPFWIENKTWNDGSLIYVGLSNKSFITTDVYPNSTFKMIVKFQDFASNISSNAHLISIGLNSDNWRDSTFIDKYEKVVLQTELNSSDLHEGNNILNILSLPTNATINACIFDWYEVEYPRYLLPIDERLNFNFPFIENNFKTNIKLQNITSGNFSLWKYGEAYKKYNVSKNNNKIVFADTILSNDRFVFMDESKIFSPKFYYAKQFKNLRSSNNKADYIAITHKKFRAKVDDYTKFISENYNIEAKVIDIDDIYDEYSYGFFNPEAIKDFLKSTHNNWQAPVPQNVVLIGGATYDYYGNKSNNLGIERVVNYVPSFGASVSDNWFVTWDTTGAYIPQMNIGRIPVTTNEELDWYFEKHQNYLAQDYDDWNKKYLFFSGGNPTKPSELNSMRESNQYIIDNYVTPNPIGGKSKHFYKTINPLTNFGFYTSEYVQNAIDDGAVFISYLGHSGTQTWDNSITDPAELTNNKNRYPIITDFGCSTGRFAEPDVVSFSQAFTVNNDGQALAYIGNASLGFLSTSLTMPKLFYKKILKENIFTVSEAHRAAKIEMLQTYGTTGIYELFALTNTFIGDPLLSLPIPPKPNLSIIKNDIVFQDDELSDLQDSTFVLLHINNYGKVIDDSLDALILHQFKTKIDSSFLTIPMPQYSNSINIGISIKGEAGNHNLKVVLDPLNKIDELNKDDNSAEINFYVSPSSIRPILQYSIENGLMNKIKMLNPSKETLDEHLVFELANDDSFNAPTIIEQNLDSVLTTVNLNLDVGKRYWGRTKLKSSNNNGSVFSFYNGQNSKYSLTDSIAISNCNLNNLKNNGTIKLDTAIVKFELLSAGFNDGNTALIKRSGINYIPESTLAGHHVVLFDTSPPYKFVEYHYFNTLAGGENITNYIQLIDTLSSNYFVAIAVSDEGTPRNADLKAQIKSLGSQYIDNVGWRASWAFIGRKGATSGTMPEAYSSQGNGSVTIDTTISFLSDSGSMLTSEIGPTGKWDRLVVSQETPSNSTIYYTPIGIKLDGTLDTLSKLVVSKPNGAEPYADLSFINSKNYSKLKILADFNASDDKLSPILKYLGVNYTDVAELAMNYQVVTVEKDSIIQSDKNKLRFFIYNVGETKADSVSVKIELQKPDNSSIILNEFTTSIDSSSKKKFEYDFEILNSYGYGDMAYLITVDEDEKITEFFKGNNFYRTPFYVQKDTITNVNKAEINVKFDGFDIMDGDFVSNKPNILFEINYSNSFPTNDTTAVIFKMDNKKVYYSNMNIEYDAKNKSIKYNYKPDLEDGQHFLKAFGNSILLGNYFGLEKLFTVSNKLKAVDIYNFPNPASDLTDFTFRLAKIPEEVNIKIYTIAGRLIKTFNLQSYDLKADINKVHWNLTDEDGDKIANGVYLYKLILKDEDKVEHYYQKLAVVR